MIKKNVVINGVHQLLLVDGEVTLANVLRGQLHMTGTKIGCGKAQCGACSVIVDGKVIRSCVTKMKRIADDAEITTIEGVGTKEHLHPLQLAWMIHGAAQCGFCSPGFIVSAKQLLEENINSYERRCSELVPKTQKRLSLHRV